MIVFFIIALVLAGFAYKADQDKPAAIPFASCVLLAAYSAQQMWAPGSC